MNWNTEIISWHENALWICFQNAGDAVKATFELSPGLVKNMHMDEESFDLTTTQSIPQVSLDDNDGKTSFFTILLKI